MQFKHIHCAKTGGASIETTIKNLPNILWNGHSKIEKEDSQYYTFTSVRNPYDRVFSMYNFYKYKRNVVTEDNFEQFVRNISSYFNVLHGGKTMTFRPCFDYLSIDGELRVNRVLKFESLNKDWFEFATEFNFPRNLSHINVNSQKPKFDMSVYTPESKEIVGELFKNDFIHFGYSF